jgi:neopullulanase
MRVDSPVRTSQRHRLGFGSPLALATAVAFAACLAWLSAVAGCGAEAGPEGGAGGDAAADAGDTGGLDGAGDAEPDGPPGDAESDGAPADVGADGESLEDTGADGDVASFDTGTSDTGGDTGPPIPPCGTTTFSWNAGATPVTTAVVAGSFNGWGSTEATGGWPMTDPDGNGVYSTTRVLEPGTYQYKFVIDGSWYADPGNPQGADDGFGGHNSVLVVECGPGGGDATLWLESWEVDEGAGAVAAGLRFEAGGEALAPGSVSVTLNHVPVPAGAVSVSGQRVSLTLSGLPDGIHDVRVTAASVAGHTAGPILLKLHLGVSTDWADAVLYFAMTDRFRNGNPTNDAPVAGVDARVNWQGGDFAGLRQTLAEGYFEGLGVNALWISWPIDNFSGCEPGGRPAEHRCGMSGQGHATTEVCYTAYHGYWPRNIDAVDAHFGTREELFALVDEAHARGIRVLLDFTANHVHTSSPLFTDRREELFNWPYHGGEHVCGDVGWDTEPETCWFTAYLADFDFRRQAAIDVTVEQALRWIVDTGADGFRVDAVKHVHRDFVRALRRRIGNEVELTGVPFYLVGETFTGDAGLIASYVGDDLLHGQFDFPMNLRVLEAFATETLGLDALDTATRGIKGAYGQGLMSNFAGNHDIARFTSMAAGDIYCGPWDEVSNAAQGWLYPPGPPSDPVAYQRLRLALTYVMTVPGVPLLYYGDEFGMPGAGDPDNRRFMRFGGELSATEAATLAFVRRLGQVRAEHAALRTGAWGADLWKEATLLAYSRTGGGETALVVLNRGANARALSLSLGGLGVANGTVYVDALADSPAHLTVSGGQLAVTVPGRTPMILVPR